MLILTRRPAETIYIGEQVTVTVLGVVGNQVRFGIEAPRSITIDRAEIYERKKRTALGNANGNVAAPTSTPAETPAEPNGNVAYCICKTEHLGGAVEPNPDCKAPLHGEIYREPAKYRRKAG